jgi:2-phospho-L-lactate/phosphoenolpyruvate guanylyltransferase
VRTAAILPVKCFTRAKQRLRTSVADTLRRELAGAMVADVLDALAHSEAIEQTILVTCEQSAAQVAVALGAIVVADDTETGQSAAAALGIARALGEGFERVLCVPGDCPALEAAELDALLYAHSGDAGGSAAVIVPDRHGTGTNGLLLTPPDAIAPSFGPGSCERHRALAHSAGLTCRVERVPSLLLDIDTGSDLDALRERLAAHPTGALRTRAVLGVPGPSLASARLA